MVKCGQWIAAQEQGRAAARTLLAGDEPMPALSLLPRYWSHQMGLRIEVCGELDERAEVEITEARPGRRLPARYGVVATYYRDGRLVGTSAVNAPRPFTTLARTMLLDEPPITMVAGGTSRELRDLGVTTPLALPSSPNTRWYPDGMPRQRTGGRRLAPVG
jgi:hypothetical protein